MTELETQVAKIQISNSRQANAYVFVMAEKIDATESELYVICELPLFNPAAAVDCQHIAEAIGSSLRRSYRKSVHDNSFENALAQINEELAKLAGLGKTHWIGKLNALVAVKAGANLSIAIAGKMTALMYREGRFITIAESSGTNHPLKTFENFSVGKLKLDDALILSTNQLFNHVSVDRLRKILESVPLVEAAAKIIEILQDNAGPEVAFGTVLALQVEPGAGGEGEVDMEEYLATAPAPVDTEGASLGEKFKIYAVGAASQAKQLGNKALALIKNPKRPDVKGLINKNQQAIGLITSQFKRASSQIRPETFQRFSRQKKFFFISIVVLLVALIVNIAVTKHYQQTKTANKNFADEVAAMQKLANDANAAFLYQDPDQARSLLQQLTDKLKEARANADKSHQQELDDIGKQVADLTDKLEKKTTVNPTTVATLSNSDRLISLPNAIATETNRTIVSYNPSTGKVQDNVLKSSEDVVLSTLVKSPTAVIYNGKELFSWNFQTGILSQPFSDSVPGRDHIAGMKAYPVNGKVYLVDTQNSKIFSFAATDKGLSKPATAVDNPALGKASDLAIDGNIYVIAGGTILKFSSGKQVDFKPSFTGSLSGNALIYAQTDFKNIYILDKDNKRIMVLDKTGKVTATLISGQFTNPKDLSIDEKNKTIYLLNDSSLLKFNF